MQFRNESDLKPVYEYAKGMGALTLYLQREFLRLCPEGWTASVEKKLLSDEMESFLGYGPRVDLVLEKNDGTERLWIEFEASRADPVASHARFATSRLFLPRPETDVFVSMVSPHVAHGRRNLAANTVFPMRNIGMNAFQTVLLPRVEGREIKRMNHLDQEMKWGKRTVAYFAYDPRTKSFAPAKFCAYTVVVLRTKTAAPGFHPMSYSKMAIDNYVRIDSSNGIFDSNKAWRHLAGNLCMEKTDESDERPAIMKDFEYWMKRNFIPQPKRLKRTRATRPTATTRNIKATKHDSTTFQVFSPSF